MARAVPGLDRTARLAVLAGAAATLLVAGPAFAIPQYARQHQVRCVSCHSLPPKLNAAGEDFLARGYRLPPGMAGPPAATVPLAAWISGRFEDHGAKDFDETFLNRVELISGGPIGDLPLSYFVEWRVLSLETRDDGSLRDRSGRFEDVYLNVEPDDAVTLTVGQFRTLRQVDVSRRLSLTEPAVFSTSIPGDPSGSSRIQSLRAFAPAGRSPGASIQIRSVGGERASDGLFHAVTVPLVGEVSIPLTPEARDEASFEFEGRPKGAFLETFYRRRLTSIGAHGLIDDDRWMIQGVGVLNLGDLHATGALGVDGRGGRRRGRFSIEAEYVPTIWTVVRAGLGFRVEQITHAGREPAYIPYLALAGPNLSYTLVTALQYRLQEDDDALFLEVSTLF